MLISIEGVDGSGKSTLAESIKELFIEAAIENGEEVTVDVLHWSQPTEDALTEYLGPLRDYDPADYSRLVICDRHWLGEMVYGPIYRETSIVTDPIAESLNDWMNRHGAVQVLLDPPSELVRARLAERGEDFLQPEHVARVMNKYYELAVRFRFSIIDKPGDRLPNVLLSVATVAAMRTDRESAHS